MRERERLVYTQVKEKELKHKLFTPGPTPVPEEVKLSQAKTIVHHRSKGFAEIFEEVRKGLKYVFQTKEEVLVFAASGTGAMEAVVANLFSPEDKVLVTRGGKFGERWAEIATAFGIQVLPLDIEWGRAPNPDLVEERLRQDPEIKAVFTQLAETSTGVAYDIKSMARIVKSKRAILVVDAISGLGAEALPMDEWGVDVVVSGSQKGLMIPPGLAFVVLSPKAWQLTADSKLPKYYWDFKKAKKAQEKNQTPYTPAITLICALRESLRLLEREGWESVLARHAKLAKATRQGVLALELRIFSKTPSNVLTAVEVPSDIEAKRLRGLMRDRYGVEVAGGQAELAGKIIRIAHLGWMEATDIIVALSALEMSLAELGYPVQLGKGVAAAQKILREQK